MKKAEIDIEKVRARLRKAMADAKIKARPLAEAAGLGQNAVRDILDGSSNDPRISTIVSLSLVLDVPISFLLGTDVVPAEVEEDWTEIPQEDRERAAQVLKAFKRARA